MITRPTGSALKQQSRKDHLSLAAVAPKGLKKEAATIHIGLSSRSFLASILRTQSRNFRNSEGQMVTTDVLVMLGSPNDPVATVTFLPPSEEALRWEYCFKKHLSETWRLEANRLCSASFGITLEPAFRCPFSYRNFGQWKTGMSAATGSCRSPRGFCYNFRHTPRAPRSFHDGYTGSFAPTCSLHIWHGTCFRFIVRCHLACLPCHRPTCQ